MVTDIETRPRVVFVIRACIVDGEGKILLIKRNKFDRYAPEKWELPGGKLEKFQEPFEALYDEIDQETGLEAEVESKLVYLDGHINKEPSPYTDLPYIFVVAICTLKSNNEVELSHEHDEYVWIDPNEALSLDIKDEDAEAIQTLLSNDFLKSSKC